MNREALQDFLVREGLGALQEAVELISLVEQKCEPPPATGFTIYSNGEMQVALRHLCECLGSAASLLLDGGDQRPSETRAVADLRRERASAVAALCSGLDLAPLRDRNLRNSMVHMDERLARITLSKPRANWIMNLALSGRAAFTFSPEIEYFYFRVYVADERKLLHLNGEYDIGAIKSSAASVLERLQFETNA